MSVEEKSAIELLRAMIKNKPDTIRLERRKGIYALQLVLNLIENQQKELDNLKKIEKSHKEENGKLRVELEKEKQKTSETLRKQLELYQNKLYEEKEKNKNTGKLVKNKIDGTIGIVLREWKTGQVQVLEKIQPKVINTHDSWKTLEILEEK